MHVHTPDEKTASLLKQRDASFCLINRLIPYSEKFYTFDDIRKGNYPICDEYLVGSDQTWNGLKVADQDVYMLDFLGGKKGYTYAVSFGITRIPSGMIGDYKRRIQNFHSLLVRETESVELCNSLGRNDAQLVLDPTLLLSENEYAPVYENKELVDGKFILVYSLNHSLKIYKEAYALAKREGCKMVMLKRDFCPPLPEEFDNSIELYDVSVGGFLWLIKNAECVITNSYHALLFSINMNRFFYLYLDNSDEENSRLLTTVGILGLKDRVFWETDYLPRTICPIEYDAVNDRLSEKRQHSINLLRESLLRN